MSGGCCCRLGSKLRRVENHLERHRHRVLLLAVWLFVWESPGAAQAALILTSIKTASPLPAGAAAAISGVINEQVKKLLEKDSAVVHVARQVLIDEEDAPGVAGVSSDFQKEYVNSLFEGACPDDGQDKEIQHNVAVIFGAVAAKS